MSPKFSPDIACLLYPFTDIVMTDLPTQASGRVSLAMKHFLQASVYLTRGVSVCAGRVIRAYRCILEHRTTGPPDVIVMHVPSLAQGTI